MKYFWVGLAGTAGALSRYLLGALVSAHVHTAMPWGTLLINLSGAFLLGLLAGWGIDRGRLPAEWRAPITVGFVGAYTTFSTWSVDTVMLLDAGRFGLATANILLSIGLGLPLTWLGLRLGSQPQRTKNGATR
jgi:CrcB protein